MHWTTLRILLQEQGAGALRIIGILLNHRACCNTRNDLTSRQGIVREFVVSMLKNSKLTGSDQAFNFVLKGFQSLPRSLRLGRVTPLLSGEVAVAQLLRLLQKV
jgi:hypothetical protein